MSTDWSLLCSVGTMCPGRSSLRLVTVSEDMVVESPCCVSVDMVVASPRCASLDMVVESPCCVSVGMVVASP